MKPELPFSNSTSMMSDPGKFTRWTHWLYFNGTGIGYLLARRLRPAGIGLGVAFVLAGCLGMSQGIGQSGKPTYQLFSLGMAMFIISLPSAFFRRASLEARRELPRFGTAGQPLRYSVQVWQNGKKSLQRAWLTETPSDPRPSLADFSSLREPGEEERNAFDRKFAYFRWRWILLGNRLFLGGNSREHLHLKTGERSRVFIDMVPLRRGVIRLDDLRVLLPDLFGLVQRCQKIKSPAATLTILPHRFPLPKIELPGSAAFKVSGDTNTNSVGSSGEFVGLRDYRPGDPLRMIHWKSWARTGRPIVKELEDTYYPRFGLVVDTLSTDRTDHRFEEVISVAASFAASIDTSESLLDLMFIKDEAHKVTAGRGIERAEKLLEVLAGVSPERTEHYNTLSQLILNYRDDLTSCLIIFNGWDAARANFLQRLRSQGIVCVPIIIGTGPNIGGAPGYWLESGQIARDLQRLPSQLNSQS